MKEDIFQTNPIVSTTICSLIGIALVGNLTVQEQMALGNWLMLISQALITNATSQGLIQSRLNTPITNINSKKVKKVYNPLFYDINTLRGVLKAVGGDSYNDCIDLFNKSFNQINEELNKLKN